MLLRGGLATLLVTCLAAGARAQGGSTDPGGPGDPGPSHTEGEPGSGSWSVRLGYYDRSDSGQGNPFLDETLTVIEPVVLFDTQLTRDFGYWAQFSYDNVSSASIERLSAFPNQSGASGDNYVGLDLGTRYRLDQDRLLTGRFGYSTEYDYSSLHVGAGLLFEAEDRNSSLSTNLDVFYDTVDIIRFDGSEEGTDNRTSIAAGLSWYQVLSPTWHGELGLTISQQSGFLETAYNAVVVEDPNLPPNPNLDNLARGFEITEELPDQRLRVALYGRARHLLSNGQALELGGRLYQDDWGIQAFHVEPRWIVDLSEDWMLQLRYRFYDQTGADAWARSFTDQPEERTQDSDLAPFDSQLYGARLFWFSGATRWDFGLDWLSRSDGLDHAFVSVGWSWNF